MCESLKDLISKLGRNNIDVKEYELKLKKHILHQKSYKSLYHTWMSKSVQSKDEFLCVIPDKIDHAKTALPKFQVTNKMISRLGQLPITLIGMIAHGHGDENYVLDYNELWPNVPNLAIESFCVSFKIWKRL